MFRYPIKFRKLHKLQSGRYLTEAHSTADVGANQNNSELDLCNDPEINSPIFFFHDKKLKPQALHADQCAWELAITLVTNVVTTSKTDEIRITIERGSEIENGTGAENECGIEIKTDTKVQKIHSMSMLTELRTLTIWTSHPQERAEQRLPGQLVNK
ncbi:hypothetical protein EVAR_87457_1 [Eumeta japonica]|uniref:Uncharacterized protein n=1 Tax=Eumeta variegata TaxID=151549 RepID=A0A4C1VY52_EUMVA|nr:hypothetical protein EVAR_87457_1 [Eumeta japonica]